MHDNRAFLLAASYCGNRGWAANSNTKCVRFYKHVCFLNSVSLCLLFEHFDVSLGVL